MMTAGAVEAPADPRLMELVLSEATIAEMNACWDRFEANLALEQARQKATGDPRVSPAHTAAQTRVMARLIRRMSRFEGGTFDRDGFDKTRQAAFAAAAERGDVDAEYSNQMLLDVVDAVWLSCASCGARRSDLRMCGGCRAVRYCDVTCQRAHRSEHRDSCVRQQQSDRGERY